MAPDRRSDPGNDADPDRCIAWIVVEVADSSLRYDRLEKVPRYGSSGIPETWLVDAEARTVTVYTGPGSEGYAQQHVRRRGDTLAATSVPELGFPVDAVFGE